ncbi:hypothetical protein CRUP_014290 [Coryphaenoides rupestris]|nr:hypothetical protein CRUP_014290 [Coryphaenoides rupestris]
MGRHQVNPTRKYYIFDSASNKSLCQIVGCEARIAGNHGGNLQRHIEKKHPHTYQELQRQLGAKRPAGDGGHTTTTTTTLTLRSLEEREEEEEEEAYEYDSAASVPNIFPQYRPLTPPDMAEQAVSFRLKGENDEDLLSNENPPPHRALRHDVVLKQFTDIMLADMQQIQDPLLLMKLRRDVTDLVFKAQMPSRFQMSSEPCSSTGALSTYLKTSRKQKRANRNQRMPTVGGGGGGGGGGGAGAVGEEWRESMSELNSSSSLQTHQVKAETESLDEMEIPVYFPPINLEGNNKG